MEERFSPCILVYGGILQTKHCTAAFSLLVGSGHLQIFDFEIAKTFQLLCLGYRALFLYVFFHDFAF
jgi:hypothetical protein